MSNIDFAYTAINIFPKALIIVDKDGQIIISNKAFMQLVKKEAVEGINCRNLISNIATVNFNETKTGCLLDINNRTMNADYFSLKKDGSLIGGIFIFKGMIELNEAETRFKDRFQKGRYTIDNIVGESVCIKELKELIRRSARSNSTVLITGESGTGKELVAHSIHTISKRRSWPFIRINCAAMPESIFESELFGYAEGAFTGAQKGGKAGKFEAADNGTIFLDEIGDMSCNMQSKLLRVLQEHEIERLGENKIRQIDVRIIAATNQNLTRKVKKGQFREDLYYRLQVINIRLPSLRERKEDIPILVKHFLEKYNRDFERNISSLDDQLMHLFMNYDWPGNIRHLENVIEQAYTFTEGNCFYLNLDSIPQYMRQSMMRNTIQSKSNLLPLLQAKDYLEKKTIEDALNQVSGNRTKAAQILGLTRASLYKKMYKHELI